MIEFLTKLKQFHQENRQVNFIIFILVVLIVILGLNMLLSASAFWAEQKYNNPYFFFQKQLLFALIGIAILVMTSQLHYSFWQKVAWPLYGISILLLVLVFVPGIGKKAGGAYRWLNIFGASLQPSDIVKFTTLLVLVRIFANKEKLNWVSIGISLMVIIIPFILIAIEPDFSTALHLLMSALAFLLLTSFPLWFLGAIALMALPVTYFGIVKEPYRLKRFISFLDPYHYRFDGGFQLIASYKAFLAGGFWGNGLGEGLKRHNLQARHTDFILAATAEDLGFIGVIFVLTLYMILAVYGFYLASKVSDNFARLLATAILLIFLIQTIINIGVTMGLMPTTGINLPLISYGGSSLLIYLMMFGIFLNISRETDTSQKGYFNRQ